MCVLLLVAAPPGVGGLGLGPQSLRAELPDWVLLGGNGVGGMWTVATELLGTWYSKVVAHGEQVGKSPHRDWLCVNGEVTASRQLDDDGPLVSDLLRRVVLR